MSAYVETEADRDFALWLAELPAANIVSEWRNAILYPASPTVSRPYIRIEPAAMTLERAEEIANQVLDADPTLFLAWAKYR